MEVSTLINGLGRSSTNLTTALAVVNVKQGKRYRFRLISISCEPAYNFTIDGHTLTVIEADGVETSPLEVDLIPILPGIVSILFVIYLCMKLTAIISSEIFFYRTYKVHTYH